MYKIIAELNTDNLVVGIKQVKSDYDTASNEIITEIYDTSIVGKNWNGTAFEEAPATGAPDYGTKLSKLKFKQRMTAAERIAIRQAGENDPIVFDFMDLQSDATYIDLSLPETIGGVQYLEAQGHLATGRADEILNTPVTQGEAYQ